MKKPEKIRKLDFGTLEFFDCYVVSRLNEEVIFDQAQLAILLKVCRSYYADKNFVYISERVHNYNVNPIIYLGLGTISQLCGIAITSQHTPALNMARFEKNFTSLPFEIFQDLRQAMTWAAEICEEKSKK